MYRVMNNNQQTVHQVPRNYPPCVLEWRANRNRVNMALSVGFYDGKSLSNTLKLNMRYNKLISNLWFYRRDNYMRDRFLDNMRRIGQSCSSKSRSGEHWLDHHALESIRWSGRYCNGDQWLRLRSRFDLGDGIGTSFSCCETHVLGTTQKQLTAYKKARSACLVHVFHLLNNKDISYMN